MEITNILRKYNFKYKKSLGQNFIGDVSLLRAIVKDADVGEGDLVLEVGAGAGSLTRALAEKAAEVLAFEVDEALAPVLAESLDGLDNVKVYFRDVLSMSDQDIEALTSGRKFKVVANLPYYITTPLIMRFLESDLPVVSLTVMVQKEVADRLAADASTSDYGAITLAVRLRGEAKVVRKVSAGMFFPPPKVDSAVVNITIHDEYADGPYLRTIKKLIKAGFAMRRKTLINNIISAFPIKKEEATQLLVALGFDANIRGEALDLQDYVKIASAIDGIK